MGIFLFFAVVYLVYGVFVLVTLFRSMGKGERESELSFSGIVMIITEIVFTIIGPVIGFMRFDEYGPEIPFAKQHVITVILFVFTSAASFWIARFTPRTANPILRILVSAGLLQGLALCGIVSIHFIAFIPLGMIYPFIGFELLSPVFAFFLLLREFYFYNKVEFNLDDALPYREELGFIPLPIRILRTPVSSRLLIYGALLFVLVLIQMLLCFGIGQDIDALIKAFTHSVGFVFSR